LKTADSIDHAAKALGLDVELVWVSSLDMGDGPRSALNSFDAFLVAPGRFRDLDLGIAGVEFVRKSGRPALGACGGCQNMVLECVRNELGWPTAEHEAYHGPSEHAVIRRLPCSLRGRRMAVKLTGEGIVHAAYGVREVDEQYYSEFGINSEIEDRLNGRGFTIVGRDVDGAGRIYALQSHVFYVATLFAPQLKSTFARPHPIVTAFLAAADSEAGRSRTKVDARAG
jgi:CTP synthase (UTP-ammonia lyase)